MKKSNMIPLYIVRFLRFDDCPDEEYSYLRFSDAENHYLLYINDTSGLYYEVQLLEAVSGGEKILSSKSFLALTSTQIELLKKYGTEDQLETCMTLRSLSEKHKIADEYAAVTARIILEKLSPKQYSRFFNVLVNDKV